MSDSTTLVEQFDDFTIRWKYQSHWAGIEVFEMLGMEDDGTRIYNKKDYVTSPDPVGSIDEAEPYLTGSIKWDGCSDIDFGYHHWCGPTYFLKHFALLERLYKRAQQLMTSGGYEAPWPAVPATEDSGGGGE